MVVVVVVMDMGTRQKVQEERSPSTWTTTTGNRTRPGIHPKWSTELMWSAMVTPARRTTTTGLGNSRLMGGGVNAGVYNVVIGYIGLKIWVCDFS